jgi:hypothetical protein
VKLRSKLSLSLAFLTAVSLFLKMATFGLAVNAGTGIP